MIKRHCFVADVGIAIEKLADAFDPERTKPFGGDIIDLLEWAERDVLAMRQQLGAKDVEIARLKTVPMKYRRMAFNAQLQDENAQLSQQLADRDEQISDLTISSDTYFAERNSARDVWRRASKDRDELRQQLDAKQAEVDDLGDDLAQVKRQLAKRDKQVMLLHFELFNSAEYIDTLGGTSLEARKTLAATEQWK